MSARGWPELVEGHPWLDGEPIAAYSEFMPPPRLGRAPYGELEPWPLALDDPHGWSISEVEEELELRPGLQRLASQILEDLVKLGQGEPAYPIAGPSRHNLEGNPYWPPELAAAAGRLGHERYVTLLPLALSRTQDDKGRVRWTLFGCSEQGPERALWRSFSSAQGQEVDAAGGLAWISAVLREAYGVVAEGTAALVAAGLRVLPSRRDTRFPEWAVDPPAVLGPLLLDENASVEGVRFVLTFRPFAELPASVRERYLDGRLCLLPFPGSLVFWGMPTYQRLRQDTGFGIQVPLLRLVGRRGGARGLRVPQSGWLEERPDSRPSAAAGRRLLETYARTSRFDRVRRYEDEDQVAVPLAADDRVTRVLFSTELDAVGLYGKPLARNCQIWTDRFELLLDGPRAGRGEIERTAAELARGGIFGYRFFFPPMRVGRHEVYWHRPLVAFCASSGGATLVEPAPLGYLTAYPAGAADLSRPVELWPRLRRRPARLAALTRFRGARDRYAYQTALNVVRLLDSRDLLGARLPRALARHLLRAPKEESLAEWLAALQAEADDPEVGRQVVEEIEAALEPAAAPPAREAAQPSDPALTFGETATRAFEEALWADVAHLSQTFVTKDNADCVDDEATLARLGRRERDLDRLGDHLLARHARAIAEAGSVPGAVCGDLPFAWRTDFDYPRLGGWSRNRAGAMERNLLVVIPGRDRGQAIVMADHYDTAYMEDVYDRRRGGTGARVAAAGADDNYTATATLLAAAPIFLRLAREGRLERDVWLLHLTGEEFPADCLGARHFCQALVERGLRLRTATGASVDLSGTRVVGAFVLDMIGHNRESNQDVFQISPGRGAAALRLAWQTLQATERWSDLASDWNRRAERRGKGRGRRSDGSSVPPIASHPHLHAEVRTQDNPHSSLFNTDGQIFSDAGAPVVLLMENYDIKRAGYHDTQDTLANIDLDYFSAVAAIAIEAVARGATER